MDFWHDYHQKDKATKTQLNWECGLIRMGLEGLLWTYLDFGVVDRESETPDEGREGGR